DAESWIGLHSLGEMRSCVVATPLADAHQPRRAMAIESQLIIRTEPLPPERVILGVRRIAAVGVNMRSEIERGGRGAIERDRAGDRAGRRLEIVAKLEQGQSCDGEGRRVVA